MKNLKIIFLICIFVTLNNCQGFNDAMSGKNSTSTDEFLVKKKDPLVLPPKYEELPLPKSEKEKNKSIESLLGSSKELSGDSKNISNLENMILKELRKKN